MSVPEIRRPGGSIGFGWDPWREFDDSFQRMGRVFSQLLGETPRSSGAGIVTWSPRVDVEEDPDCHLIEVEVPGVAPEALSVEVVEGHLVVHGSMNEIEHKDHEHRATRRSGSFDYRLSLPSGTDPELVRANLSDGLLTIRIPKSSQAQRKQIPIGQPEPGAETPAADPAPGGDGG